MKNPDLQQDQLRASLQSAFESGEDSAVMDAVLALGSHIQGNILEEARSIAFGAAQDNAVLAARGVRQLTSEEKKYYNAIISGNNDGNAFDGAEALMPPTVINRVFEDLTEDHELLRHINFRHATATTEWIVKVGDVPLAYWGKLKAASKELLDEGFTKLQMNLFLLTCFIPVGNSMLELGPEWLDRYVREILTEAMALALEKAIVDGDGKDCPIGMMRKLDDANHPRKSAVKIDDLEPVTLGTHIMAPLSRKGKRTVNDVIIVVNPLDYWEKVFGATTYMNALGQYVYNILPIPAKFIQSPAMPRGFMAAGMAKDYFMGVGFKTGIQYSDEYRFIERERVYKTDIAANGQPLDNDAFLLFNISDLKPTLNKNVTPAPTV
jgi:hypothetical protein